MQYKPSITFTAVPQLAVVAGAGMKNSNTYSSGFLQFPSLIPRHTNAASCCTKSALLYKVCHI